MELNKFAVFDVETPNSRNDRMSAIGITLIDGDRIMDSFGTLVNPETYFAPFHIALTGITPEMAEQAPAFCELWDAIEPILQGRVLVAHNAVFDLGVLSKCLRSYCISYSCDVPYLCTVRMGRKLLDRLPNHKLDTLAAYYGIPLDHHKADSDAKACAEILLRYLQRGANIDEFLRVYDLDRGKTLSAVEQKQFFERYSSNSFPR